MDVAYNGNISPEVTKKKCCMNRLFYFLFAVVICCVVSNSAIGQENKKNPTVAQSFFGAGSLVGVWGVNLEGMILPDEYFIINKDGTVKYHEEKKIIWEGTYKIKGDNMIVFDNLKYLDKAGNMKDFNYSDILNTNTGEEEPVGCFIGGEFSIEPNDAYRYFCSGDELTLTVDLGNFTKEANLVRTEAK